VNMISIMRIYMNMIIMKERNRIKYRTNRTWSFSGRHRALPSLAACAVRAGRPERGPRAASCARPGARRAAGLARAAALARALWPLACTRCRCGPGCGAPLFHAHVEPPLRLPARFSLAMPLRKRRAVIAGSYFLDCVNLRIVRTHLFFKKVCPCQTLFLGSKRPPPSKVCTPGKKAK